MCAGREFLMPKYGMYMQSKHGTIICFKANVVYRTTMENIGYTEVGACVYTKMKIVNRVNKRRVDIDLEQNKTSIHRCLLFRLSVFVLLLIYIFHRSYMFCFFRTECRESELYIRCL